MRPSVRTSAQVHPVRCPNAPVGSQIVTIKAPLGLNFADCDWAWASFMVNWMAMPERAIAITVKTALVYRSVVIVTPLLWVHFHSQATFKSEYSIKPNLTCFQSVRGHLHNHTECPHTHRTCVRRRIMESELCQPRTLCQTHFFKVEIPILIFFNSRLSIFQHVDFLTRIVHDLHGFH